VPGFVCLGWEDARAYVAAAKAEAAPVILQAGPSCRAHTPLPVLAAMFRHLGAAAQVPVVANIAQTKAVADLARSFGASSEGELGFVGYAQGKPSSGTDPAEVARFAEETGLDALAVSVGNVHLQTAPGQRLDRARIAAIEGETDVPLVIHGGSGLDLAERSDLCATTAIAKINIGTELRQAFGKALRGALADDAEVFDRVAILSQTEAPLTAAAREVLRQLGANGRAG